MIYYGFLAFFVASSSGTSWISVYEFSLILRLPLVVAPTDFYCIQLITFDAFHL